MPPIQIEMLYFAAVRERTGKAREAFSLDDAGNLSTLETALLARYPDLAPLLPHVRWARNEAFVATDDLDVLLQAGDRVALIPPVSGGAPRSYLARVDARGRRIGSAMRVAVEDDSGMLHPSLRWERAGYVLAMARADGTLELRRTGPLGCDAPLE